MLARPVDPACHRRPGAKKPEGAGAVVQAPVRFYPVKLLKCPLVQACTSQLINVSGAFARELSAGNSCFSSRVLHREPLIFAQGLLCKKTLVLPSN